MDKVGKNMPESLRETGIGVWQELQLDKKLECVFLVKIYRKGPSRMRSNKEVRDDIIEKLTTVVDPELNIDIVNLGLIYNVDLDEDGICLVGNDIDYNGLPTY